MSFYVLLEVLILKHIYILKQEPQKTVYSANYGELR